MHYGLDPSARCARSEWTEEGAGRRACVQYAKDRPERTCQAHGVPCARVDSFLQCLLASLIEVPACLQPPRAPGRCTTKTSCDHSARRVCQPLARRACSAPQTAGKAVAMMMIGAQRDRSPRAGAQLSKTLMPVGGGHGSLDGLAVSSFLLQSHSARLEVGEKTKIREKQHYPASTKHAQTRSSSVEELDATPNHQLMVSPRSRPVASGLTRHPAMLSKRLAGDRAVHQRLGSSV